MDKYQIGLIFSLSNKYFYSLSKIINLFLPNFIYNRLDKNAFQDIVELEIIKSSFKIKSKPKLLHNINNISYNEILKKEF